MKKSTELALVFADHLTDSVEDGLLYLRLINAIFSFGAYTENIVDRTELREACTQIAAQLIASGLSKDHTNRGPVESLGLLREMHGVGWGNSTDSEEHKQAVAIYHMTEKAKRRSRG